MRQNFSEVASANLNLSHTPATLNFLGLFVNNFELKLIRQKYFFWKDLAQKKKKVFFRYPL